MPSVDLCLTVICTPVWPVGRSVHQPAAAPRAANKLTMMSLNVMVQFVSSSRADSHGVTLPHKGMGAVSGEGRAVSVRPAKDGEHAIRDRLG